jgi:FdhE protein
MSIRIIPQDELGSSEKRTAEYIPPLLFPRLKNLYNRRAERLRELAENNPLGDFLRLPRWLPTRRKWCCTTTRCKWI